MSSGQRGNPQHSVVANPTAMEGQPHTPHTPGITKNFNKIIINHCRNVDPLFSQKVFKQGMGLYRYFMLIAICSGDNEKSVCSTNIFSCGTN